MESKKKSIDNTSVLDNQDSIFAGTRKDQDPTKYTFLSELTNLSYLSRLIWSLLLMLYLFSSQVAVPQYQQFQHYEISLSNSQA